MTRAPPRTEPTGTRILEIATDHIRRHGTERTTVSLVAKEAGISHAAVYRYFSSKDALIDAITAEWLRMVETQLAVVADSPDPADDKLERLMQQYARLYRERLDGEPNLFLSFVTAVDGKRPVIVRHEKRVRSLIDRVVEEGRATEHFRGRSNERMVTFLFDSLHRFIEPHAILADRGLTRSNHDQRLARVLRVVVRAMASGAA